jgi:hypothetical protein
MPKQTHNKLQRTTKALVFCLVLFSCVGFSGPRGTNGKNIKDPRTPIPAIIYGTASFGTILIQWQPHWFPWLSSSYYGQEDKTIYGIKNYNLFLMGILFIYRLKSTSTLESHRFLPWIWRLQWLGLLIYYKKIDWADLAFFSEVLYSFKPKQSKKLKNEPINGLPILIAVN